MTGKVFTVYLGVVRALTPLMIRRRRGPRGFESLEGIVPGSSIAGALVRALRLDKPGIASDGYPVYNNGEKRIPSLPTPHTAFKIKFIPRGANTRVPKRILLPLVLSEVEARHIALNIWKGKLGFTPTGLVKPVKSAGIIPLGGSGQGYVEIEEVDVVASQVYDSVAVNPARRSAEPQMLFTYHAIPKGAEFWFTYTVPDERDLSGCYNVRIGGGRSRGFGHAEVRLAKWEQACPVAPQDGGFEAYFVWSRLPVYPDQPGGILLGGWSSVAGKPKMSLRYVLPGRIVGPRVVSGMVGDLDYCRLRFVGATPPLGHVEGVHEGEFLPRSYKQLLSRINNISIFSVKNGENESVESCA